MPFYVFAWTASILYGLYAIAAKLIGKHVLKNVFQFSFFVTLFSAIFTIPIALSNGATIPSLWSYTILAGLFLALGNVLYLSAVSKLDVSVMSPLFSLRVVITVILGYLFLNERLSLQGIGLAVVIVVAGIFAAMDEKFSFKSFFTKDIGLGLLFMMTLSIQGLFVNRAVDQTNYWTATLWMSVLAALFSFLFLYSKFRKDVAISKPSDYYTTILLAFIGCIGDLAAFKAFSGNVGISSIIISLPISMILVFVMAIWKPNLLEKHTTKVYIVRFIAAVVMIWGALKLSQ